MKNRLTVQDAALRLGVTARRVQAMIKAGRLKAEKIGPIYIITERDLALVIDRKQGRPKEKND